jgi:hypothetical protein
VALGWLWVALGGLRPYFYFLLSALYFYKSVALGGLQLFLVQGSRLDVRGSTFSLRPEHQTEESRQPPVCRKPG